MSRLLEQLRASAPEWVSSHVLRAERGISRAAVSKQVRRLVEAGYHIESSPRKGYRFLGEPERIEEASLRLQLAGTRFANGARVIKSTTGSTNDDVRALALQGAPEGSIVVCDVQEQGRGRLGRKWFGRTGDAVQMSLLLRPPLRPREGTLLPLLAAVAVFRALRALEIPDVGIKWPNDLLIHGRKVCGILCEMSVDMDRIEYAILGLGLNVNTPLHDFPVELHTVATSLLEETGKRWSRVELIGRILQEMDPLLDAAWSGRSEEVLQAWREGSITLGRDIMVTTAMGERLEGVAEDIDPSGALLLREPSGHLRPLHSGEVSLRGEVSEEADHKTF